MQVEFTPEQEAHLYRIAGHSGTDPEQLVKDATLRMLGEDARFREAVRLGVAAADRGDLVEPAEVWANVEKILRA